MECPVFLRRVSCFAVVLVWLCAVVPRGGEGQSTSGSQLEEKTPLYFSYITTKTGSFVAAGAIPAVDLALRLINDRTDILPNYTLGYTDILDSGCNSETSLDAYMSHFRNLSQPTYVTLRCCGCSTATIAVADISHYWNIPLMAGIAGANELNNRQRFEGFYRTDATSEFVGAALAEMARQFNWTQMAIVSQSESLFRLITESLDSIFESEKRTLDTTATIDKDIDGFPYHLIHNWDRDYRIIMLNTGASFAYTVMCEGYYKKWFYPRYVWITYSWYDRDWWKQDNGNSSCTQEIMRRMVNGSLAVTPSGNLVSDDRQAQTISGLTPEEFLQNYTTLLKTEPFQSQNLSEFIISGSEFDATWAMALGLQNASERIKRNDSRGCDHLPGRLVPLEELDYMNQRMGCVLRDSFQHVTFPGVTGMVQFNSNGSRDSSNTIRVHQYWASADGSVERRPVATVTVRRNESRFAFRGDLTATSLWQGGVPYDGATRMTLHHNHPALVILYSIAAVAGLVYAAVCLLFNLLFRKKKVVKLSSPNLNILIIAGAVLLYVSVFLYVFSVDDKEEALTQTILCNFRQWSVSLGYTLCFAVILAKTWRVYHIFTNPTAKKTIPKDWFLFLIVLVIVVLDLAIVLIGTAVPASRLNATLVRDVQHLTTVDDDQVTHTNFVFVCISDGAVVWLALSYVYKALLQLVAMFMAFYTRRVKIKALNDSKEIAVVIYFNSITLTLLAVVEFSLKQYHEVYAALFCLALLVEASVFLTLIFIPKMVHLVKDPEGETVMQSGGLDTTQSPTTIFKSSDPNKHHNDDEVVKLRQRLTEMELKLAEAERRNSTRVQENDVDQL